MFHLLGCDYHLAVLFSLPTELTKDWRVFVQGMVSNGLHIYTDHLLAIDSCRSPSPHCRLPMEIFTPLNIHQWTQQLQSHPDGRFFSYIIQGISSGFRIGFNHSHTVLSASSNLPTSNDSIIEDYLEREVALSRMWKFPRNYSIPGTQISPLGLVPKKNKPGKWRLIMDLSSPPGESVNDGISSELSSVSYTSLDHLASLVLLLGRGSLLVKADIQEAYRMVPVHPQDQPLLGVQWNGCIYLDKMLPFGLRSAPKIFSAVADGLQWILSQKGITHLLHYLDDFVFVAASMGDASTQKDILITTCTQLGIPLEMSKLEGPSTCLTFLGIEVDTVANQLRLPVGKLLKLKQELTHCLHRTSITKRELASLTGLLQFATKVIRPGRSFLRQLYAMQSIDSHPNHHVRLNSAARADIAWWYLFADSWNGISMLWDSHILSPEFITFSYASGSWGCGAFWEYQWFHLKWPVNFQLLSIAIKEFIPVVLAAAIFGRQWQGHLIQFSVDNMSVVHVLNSTYSKDPHLMHMVRVLVFLAAHFNFWFRAEHIEGKANSLADALSRDNLEYFLSKSESPTRDRSPDIPATLMALLGDIQDWTSPRWITLFGATLRQL